MGSLIINEIHTICKENYQKTKNMTEDELIAYTKKESAAIKERLRVLQAQKRRKDANLNKSKRRKQRAIDVTGHESYPPKMANRPIRSVFCAWIRYKMNCTPKVRQYGILNNDWGVFLCQRELPNKRYMPEFKVMVIETMHKGKLSYCDNSNHYDDFGLCVFCFTP